MLLLQRFCLEITKKILDTVINFAIIPWSGVGEIVDAPIEYNHAPCEKKIQVHKVQFLFRVFFNNATVYASVGVFVDRADDREALSFAFRLLDYPNVS
ncbi:29633_t:CDS:2, partial [Racocetra persica]